MSESDTGFPWSTFSANTLRPMLADIFRSAGVNGQRVPKEESLDLLRQIEKNGLDDAVKAFLERPTTSKRKHDSEPRDLDAESSQPRRKRGRPLAEDASETPILPRRGGRHSDPGQPGLLTRRQSAKVRGEKVPTRSWKPLARSPRKKAQNTVTGSSASTSRGASKPESRGQVFDGVEIIKRPNSKGKAKARPQALGGNDAESEDDANADEDEDPAGDVVEEALVETSSLENSSKENHPTFLELANADDEMDAEGEDVIPAEEFGSPAPQITVEPTDDQIEEARNQDMSIDIGSPAPEITIEPMADDIAMDEDEDEPVPRNGLLLPRIDTRARSVELNPEYSIEVYSPTSAQHDSDDETWVASGVNGIRGEAVFMAGGGLGHLNSLD